MQEIFYPSDISIGYMKKEKNMAAQQTNRKSVKSKTSTSTIALPLMKCNHPFVKSE